MERRTVSADSRWRAEPGEILTVDELLGKARMLLEEAFDWVWVEGEVGNLRVASSGHAYFTLGSDKAQLRAVCFRSTMRLLAMKPTNGVAVLARGRLTLYETRGDVQFVLEDLEPLGAGLQKLELEARRRRLAAEGLFALDRKRALPLLPRAVGVVTSPVGAAFSDICKVLERRAPGVPIRLAPARVQGRGAAEELCRALSLVSMCEGVDVVILGRGGGSAEDLSVFDDEAVVRAVAGCPVPVISAVGHETDVTLVDLASDARASTPSAAAELAVRDWDHWLARLRRAEGALEAGLRSALGRARHRLELLKPRLRSPGERFDHLRLRIDRRVDGLQSCALRKLAALGVALSEAQGRLARLAPERRLAENLARLAHLEERLSGLEGRLVPNRRRGLEASQGRLEALSPLAVLSRGYAITLRGGAVVRDSADCVPGEPVEVLLARGALDCLVTGTRAAEVG
jgi:exodeoxyribonuclease VII large subunit